jgi:hypothetical protein
VATMGMTARWMSVGLVKWRRATLSGSGFISLSNDLKHILSGFSSLFLENCLFLIFLQIIRFLL